MLAWVMNMGFAASPSGTPASTSARTPIIIGIGTLIRSLVMLPLLAAITHFTQRVPYG